MKRSEVTVQKLRDLGYVGKIEFKSYPGTQLCDCSREYEERMFRRVADAAQSGLPIQIQKNPERQSVEVTLQDWIWHDMGMACCPILFRPMTKDEIISNSG